MEADPSSRKDGTPPTFGEMLSRATTGTAQGFTIFDAEGDIRYTFIDSMEPSDINPAEGETWVPMTAEYAQAMLTGLTYEAPEELNEYGTPDEGVIVS